MQQGFWIRNTAEQGPAAVLELAMAAEEGGWDGVFLSDAVLEGHTEPFTQLAAIAARTERLHLGTWLTPLIARDVVHVARSIANVDRLAGGRLLVGLGLGNPAEHEGLGIARDRLGAHYDAALEVLDGLLRGDEVTRHDDWFDLEAVSLNVRPSREPRPPILLGGTWPARAPIERAARWDGYLPEWPGMYPDAEEGALTGELRALLAAYRELGGDGTVLVPRLARYGDAYDELCVELGVDWVLTCDPLDRDGVAAGPPG